MSDIKPARRGIAIGSRAAIVVLLLLMGLACPGSLRAQSFRVVLLGTGHPMPNIHRFGASTLVEAGSEKLLFDCGRGALLRLSQMKVRVPAVGVLFLTHLHSDHTVGIPDFWLTGWILGRKAPLLAFGPAGTEAMMAGLERAYEFDVHMRRDVDEKLSGEGWKITAKEVKQGPVFDENGVKVIAFDVIHGPVKPAFGYRIEYAGHVVVLSGDTTYSENLVKYAKGADLLLQEIIDPNAFRAKARFLSEAQARKVIAHHTTPAQAGKIFSLVKPKLAVYTHIVPSPTPAMIPLTRKIYSGPLVMGEDLMTIDVGKTIEVHRPGH
jgi:ribonuclease Z